MTDSSPIVVKKQDSSNTIYSSTQLAKREIESNPILDTRFQSYMRLYIFDLLNADLCDHLNNQDLKRSIIKIDNLYLSKVSICGSIVGIYESSKYYRLKVDDSTGCINVTLWRNLIFDENSLEYSNNAPSFAVSEIKNQFSDLYKLLDSIKTRVKESSVNNSIMYEPKQGDLVLIRANVNCFRQRIELNAVSCARIQNSAEELMHIKLPSWLADQVYSIPPPSSYEFEQLKNKTNKESNENNKPIGNQDKKDSLKNNEEFLSLVLKKLKQMVSSNVLDSSRKIDEFGNSSCDSYTLFSFIRSNCPSEFKFVTNKQVLDALKELELRGLVYSCEDEFHYSPMI